MTSGSVVGRYLDARAPVDLGGREARVAPLTRVSYVPTAALLVRRSALGGAGFDPGLWHGEDVDLIWRLTDLGWRVRYDPGAQVSHVEPDRWGAVLARRFRYGTSAAPLARRHPGLVPPLVLQAWPAAAVAALLARRPLAALAAYGAGTGQLVWLLRGWGVPARGVLRPMAGLGSADVARDRAVGHPVRAAGGGRRPRVSWRAHPAGQDRPAGRAGVAPGRPGCGVAAGPAGSRPGPVRARLPGRRGGLRGRCLLGRRGRAAGRAAAAAARLAPAAAGRDLSCPASGALRARAGLRAGAGRPAAGLRRRAIGRRAAPAQPGAAGRRGRRPSLPGPCAPGTEPCSCAA